jgi:hypothetical protein
MKVITALGGVSILILLKLWEPIPSVTVPSGAAPGTIIQVDASTKNKVVIIAIIGIASLISIVSALISVVDFDREAGKYETASRAISRLMDRYEIELKRASQDSNRTRLLGVWARNHIYKIEALLEDRRVFDVDFHFKLDDPQVT